LSAASAAALSIVAAFMALYLKSAKSEYALLVTLAAVVFMLVSLMPMAVGLVSDIMSFAERTSIEIKYTEPILKIIAIAYITEIASDICADSGEKALAAHAETFGKIASAVIALPLAEEVFSLILGLLD